MKESFVGCLVVIIIAVGLGALEGWIFMELWNWLVPMFWKTAPIFTFWQAWGILVLLNLIFGKRSSSSNS